MLLMGSIFLAITLATPQGLQEYAAKQVEPYEVRCMVKLWTKESNWRYKAKNKQSSAYGIPQLLNMKETNPYKQIDLGLKYIAKHRVYKGSPCKALNHHKKRGWY